MNMQSEKLHLVRMLIETEDKHILDQIKAIFESQHASTPWDEWDDEVRADVKQAIAELERGEGIPHEEVMREFLAWRKK